MNAAHRIRKTKKSNHGRFLRHELQFVTLSRIILGRIIEIFLIGVRADVPKALHPLLYLLIGPEYLHPGHGRARFIQFKLSSSSSEEPI